MMSCSATMDTGDVAETRSVPKSPPGPCTALGAGVVVTASLRAGNKVMDTTDGVEDGFAIARNVRVEQLRRWVRRIGNFVGRLEMPCRVFVREPSSDKRSLRAPFPERPCILFLGGFAGVLLAIAISQVLMFFITSLPASIPVWAVFAGLTLSVSLGQLFGVRPACRA